MEAIVCFTSMDACPVNYFITLHFARVLDFNHKEHKEHKGNTETNANSLALNNIIQQSPLKFFKNRVEYQVPRRGGTFSDLHPGGRYLARWEPDYIELGYMYSRSVSVIRSKRITAVDFRVPPYTSGLQTLPSGAFFFTLVWICANANTVPMRILY